jgi:hypothetical protein
MATSTFDRAAAAKYLSSPQYQALPADQKAQIVATMKQAANPAPESRLHKFASGAAGYLPMIGATAGGTIAGGLGLPAGPVDAAITAGGAALGGAAGKSLENTARHYLGEEAPKTLGASLASVGKEGVKQGAYDLTGSSLLAGAGKAVASKAAERYVGRPLNRYLRPTEEMFDYGNPGVELSKQNPPIISGKYGMRDFIRQRTADLTKARDAVVTKLTGNGQTVDLAAPIQRQLARANRLPTEFEDRGTGTRKALDDAWTQFTTAQGAPNQFIQGPGGAVTPYRPSRNFNRASLKDAIDFRKYLDTRIRSFDPTSTDPVKSALQSVRGAVNNSIHSTSPELAEYDKQLQGLINVDQALSKRIAHQEAGTREISAGKGVGTQIAERLHLPGTRSTPVASFAARSRRNLLTRGQNAMNSPTQRVLIRSIPRLLGGPQ